MKPNPLWDAICAAFGLSPVTRAECKRVGGIVRDLELKQATPADIAIRLARYRAEWPTVADTPEALLKHWDRFAVPGKGQSKPGRIHEADADEFSRIDGRSNG